MTGKQKEKAVIAIKKARSITDKVLNMIESDEYCVDILQQSLASIGLMKSANNIIIESHLRTCFKNAFESKSKKEQDKMIEELISLNKAGSR